MERSRVPEDSGRALTPALVTAFSKPGKADPRGEVLVVIAHDVVRKTLFAIQQAGGRFDADTRYNAGGVILRREARLSHRCGQARRPH
jgi:hypothetical protein